MSTRFTGWLAIVLTAFALVPGGAHLFALPNKMKLAEEDYFITQSVYNGWALFGIVLIAAFAAIVVFAILCRRDVFVFSLACAAALCVGLTFVIFFIWTYPANQMTNNWTVVPSNWTQLRFQWEASHAVNAAIMFLALCCISWAALLRRG